MTCIKYKKEPRVPNIDREDDQQLRKFLILQHLKADKGPQDKMH